MSAITKIEYEKLPKIGAIKENSEQTSECVVPFIENKIDNLKEETVKKFNNCLPDDLILSLKQVEKPKEYLGPLTKRTVNAINKSNPSVLRKPDNVWNFEKQRDKFKFLTDQPICSCGAGKDISFIYDAVTQANKNANKPGPSKFDLSSIRSTDPNNNNNNNETQIQVPNSLIPEEFRIVKNQGVWPLKIEETQYSTITDEHMNHLTIFPSLKPTGRNEVIQLKHTMDALLKRVGADIIDLKGPTQLHNLLEIIKQEQDIYNIIFHEVIRQVTVECKERGEILSKLRERYANLLARVPREIKSLHEEIVAQRALDRRLTEELTQFKSTITYLTDELSFVKDHDKRVAEQASIYQKDLQKALEESEKNASLLHEYHQLYELQRKRLENTIKVLIEERDLWIRTCYSIAFKVTNENKLNTAKRLNIAEKSWSKLGKHLALLQSDRDTKDIMDTQNYIETWKTTVDEIRNDTFSKEKELKKSINIIRTDINDLKKLMKTHSIDDLGNLVHAPDKKKQNLLYAQIRKILETVQKESENFSVEALIISEDKLKKCERSLFRLVQLATRVVMRHDQIREKKRQDEVMRYETLQTEIKMLHEYYRNRLTGDNGVSKYLNLLNNVLDVWQQKLNSLLNDTGKHKITINDQEWLSFYHAIDDCIEYTYKTENRIGNPIREKHLDSLPASEMSDKPKIFDHDDLINELNKWISAFSHYIDSQDSFIVEEVNIIHTKMVHWMVQALIRLAPDKEDLSEEAKRMVYETTSSVETLEKIANILSEKLGNFSNTLADRCNGIITEEENNRKPNEPSNFEKEFQNITNFTADVKEWNYTLKLLISELNGDKAHRKVISDRLGYNSTSKSDVKEKMNLEVLNEDEIEEEDDEDEEYDVINDPVLEEEIVDENQNQNKEDKSVTKDNDKVQFEIISHDSNTEYKFLDNLNFDDSNHLTEQELKSTVFNAYKTIESLQNDLIITEERAQKSEEKVAELELRLKEALERIRALEIR